MIALDFDGVIADSIKENMFTSFNAYLKLNPKTKIFNRERLTFYNFEEIRKNNKKTCNCFRELTSYTVAVHHYLIIFFNIERFLGSKK